MDTFYSGTNSQPPVLSAAEVERLLFNLLTRKYVQRADEYQKSHGLQYTTAETHDLAKELVKFMKRWNLVSS